MPYPSVLDYLKNQVQQTGFLVYYELHFSNLIFPKIKYRWKRHESVNFIERMNLSHYSSLVLKMGVRRAGSSLVPKRANCQVLESSQDLSLGLGI